MTAQADPFGFVVAGEGMWKLAQSRAARGHGSALRELLTHRAAPDAFTDDERRMSFDSAHEKMQEFRASFLEGYNGEDRVCAYSQRTHDQHNAMMDLLMGEVHASFLSMVAICEALAERIAELENRPPPAKLYAGVWKQGVTAEAGRLYTFGGAIWHCDRSTDLAPNDDHSAWTLAVKKGRDSKEARP